MNNLTHIEINNVTEIEDNHFANNSLLRYVTIGDGVKRIGKKAFSKCENLKEVVIGKNVTYIDPSTFYGSCNITSIKVSKENKNFLVTQDNVLVSLQDNTIIALTALTPSNYKIPQNIKKITRYVFSSNKVLTNVEIKGRGIKIGPSAFSDSESLKSISITGVKTLSRASFYGCKRLQEVHLSEGLIQIESHAFSGCINLESINLPSSLEQIGNSAFENCRMLDCVTIPEGITEIGYATFRNSSIRVINLPKNLRQIEDSSFLGCDKLKKITIFQSVEYINEDAFDKDIIMRVTEGSYAHHFAQVQGYKTEIIK